MVAPIIEHCLIKAEPVVNVILHMLIIYKHGPACQTLLLHSAGAEFGIVLY